MQVVWVLVAVKMVNGLGAAGPAGVESLPHWQQFTAGMYASEAQCRNAAKALGTQPGIRRMSAECQPERLQ
ncbi:MAG TPA: hypothetical protein VMF03_15155 [Steroidobacteraceae bacterium]|nr:hypothetical protein [Steroidobacteraceae bacterium]